MPHFVSLAEARKLLGLADRVLVIGCSGSGKTTLSQDLSTRHALELISIDRDVRWLPGWKARDKEQQREILSRLVQKECWVMDGSGASTFDLRLPRADLVLWVRVPRYVSLLGLARRVLRNFGKVRPLMADGCPEQIPDREFLAYIWNFEKEFAPRFIAEIDLHGPTVPVCELKSHAQVSELMRASPG